MTRARPIPPPPGTRLFLVGGLAALLTVPPGVEAQNELRGSRSSLDRQVAQAEAHNFTHLESAAQVRRFVDAGFLVPVRPNGDFRLHYVSFPYARPEVKLFIERLAGQYRAACGEELVVTSLTRPRNKQPANASDRSVHPTGMAVDLRVPQNRSCRSWLERVLVSLEREGVVEATREHRPPHYHLAVFPRPYVRYVEAVTGDRPTVRVAASGEGEGEAPAVRTVAATSTGPPSAAGEYRVRRGDTLWGIARTHGTTVERLVGENGLRGRTIQVGQTLRVPVAGSGQVAGVQGDGVELLPYRVRSGDSLWAIARAHGTTVNRLMEENRLGTGRIVAGQILNVPVADND